jgi:hypothetical protein
MRIGDLLARTCTSLPDAAGAPAAGPAAGDTAAEPADTSAAANDEPQSI